jgi:hypothetical protein
VLKYTFYRVLQLVPVWLLLSVFVFAIVHALPGDAIDALVPPDAASNPATRAALEKELGLDKPLYVQYTPSGSRKSSCMAILAARSPRGVPSVWKFSHSTQFSGNALTPSPSPCNWAGIPPFWVISNTDHLTRG